jgi:hypothetical protein
MSAAMVCMLVIPALAGPALTGCWNITFYQEPNHSAGATQRINFTKTGGIVGEANSGTWVWPNYGGNYQGVWIQEGDQVKLWAKTTTPGFTWVIAISGAMTSSRFMAGDFFCEFNWAGASNYAGAWKAIKVDCNTAAPDNLGSAEPGGPASK